MRKKHWISLLILLLMGLCLMTYNPVLAEEPETDEGWDDYGADEDPWKSFEAIEDNLTEARSVDSPNQGGEPSFWYLGGFLKEDLAYSYASDTPDFSKIRSTLNLTLDLDLMGGWKAKLNGNASYDLVYALQGRDTFSSEILDEYERELEIRDAYVGGQITDQLYLRIGRQVIAWGQSESSQITDMANPRDMRELGLVDLEDARIPVTATKLTGVMDGWEVNLALTHEFRSHKTAAAGSDFDFLKDLRSIPILTLNSAETPDFQPEVLARVLKRFNGGDISLILADVYDDAPYLGFSQFSYTMVGSTPNPNLVLTPRFKRIKMMGVSGTVVSGSWQYKTDLARKTGVAVSRNDFESQMTALIAGGATPDTIYDENTAAVDTWEIKTVDQMMAGVEYSGFDNFSLALEGVVELIEEYESSLADNEISSQIGISVSHSALNDTLTTRVFMAMLLGNNGGIFRVSSDYNIKDGMTLSGGIILYDASDPDGLLYNFRNNDRLFAAIKYNF